MALQQKSKNRNCESLAIPRNMFVFQISFVFNQGHILFNFLLSNLLFGIFLKARELLNKIQNFFSSYSICRSLITHTQAGGWGRVAKGQSFRLWLGGRLFNPHQSRQCVRPEERLRDFGTHVYLGRVLLRNQKKRIGKCPSFNQELLCSLISSHFLCHNLQDGATKWYYFLQ